jgi:hypothetical protein
MSKCWKDASKLNFEVDFPPLAVRLWDKLTDRLGCLPRSVCSVARKSLDPQPTSPAFNQPRGRKSAFSVVSDSLQTLPRENPCKQLYAVPGIHGLTASSSQYQ